MARQRRSSSVVSLCGLALGAMLTARLAQPQAAAPVAQSPSPDRVAHGAYLVTTGGCHDCHTPWTMGDNGPEPDMSRRLSGHPAGLVVRDPPGLQPPWLGTASATLTSWSGPWGRSFTANLTSDVATGIGGWTEAEFIATMRTGRHRGTGRPLLPPMPWDTFRRLADEDLAAMFAYLKTVPAIRNAVPAPVPPPGPAMPPPPPPAAITTMTVAPSPADPVARGRYLVEGKGCGDCHTPMVMGSNGPEYDRSRWLAGFDARGPVPAMPPIDGVGEVYPIEPAYAGAWGMSFAANLTPDPETGLGAWTEQQFIDTLRQGRHQGRGRQLLPPMPWQAFGQMTDADLKAIFAYLRTIPAVRNKVPDPLPPSAPGGSGR